MRSSRGGRAQHRKLRESRAQHSRAFRVARSSRRRPEDPLDPGGARESGRSGARRLPSRDRSRLRRAGAGSRNGRFAVVSSSAHETTASPWKRAVRRARARTNAPRPERSSAAGCQHARNHRKAELWIASGWPSVGQPAKRCWLLRSANLAQWCACTSATLGSKAAGSVLPRRMVRAKSVAKTATPTMFVNSL